MTVLKKKKKIGEHPKKTSVTNPTNVNIKNENLGIKINMGN